MSDNFVLTKITFIGDKVASVYNIFNMIRKNIFLSNMHILQPLNRADYENTLNKIATSDQYGLK